LATASVSSGRRDLLDILAGGCFLSQRIPASHVRAALWQAAVHGQSATTVWVWERSFDPKSDTAGSIMHRPACAEAVGIVNCDLNRAADEVTAPQQAPPQLLILQSTTASVWDRDRYSNCLDKFYTAISFTGLKIGFVMERQLESGQVAHAPLLFVPDIVHLSNALPPGHLAVRIQGQIWVVHRAAGFSSLLPRTTLSLSHYSSTATMPSRRAILMRKTAELLRPFRSVQMHLAFVTVWVFLAPVLVAGEPAAATVPARPAWARGLDKPGLPNLHQVSNTLFRGAQPTAEGMKQLEALGVKTVISLRASHSDTDFLKGTRLTGISIPMNPWNPTEARIVQFLRVVTDPKQQPVFVHCEHGADRTGLMCAIYRVAVCGWTKEDAIKEMTRGGFSFHSIWMNLPKFVQELDVETVKKKSREAGEK
jgi:protein tyrosine phosphatase (PTP) superfamily phosphohydrolase (DUF442 family)